MLTRDVPYAHINNIWNVPGAISGGELPQLPPNADEWSKEYQLIVIIKYVASAANLADKPSRGIYPEGPRLPSICLPEAVSPFLAHVPATSFSQVPYPAALSKCRHSPSVPSEEGDHATAASAAYVFKHLWDI